MGTSTHNAGQKGKTPLVPSWLDQDENLIQKKFDNNEIPQEGIPDRFTTSRREFTRYINTNGKDGTKVKKSISNYIRHSLNGSENATKRLGSVRSSTSRLLLIAGALSSGGSSSVESFLNLRGLSNKTTGEVLIRLTDFICPDGGLVDEGIARDAYISAIEESPEIVDIPFQELKSEQMMIILERTMTNSIFSRITNDIGNKIILLPQKVTDAERLVLQIKDFIKGAISDSIVQSNLDLNSIPQNKAIEIIDNIYHIAFNILASEGEDE